MTSRILHKIGCAILIVLIPAIVQAKVSVVPRSEWGANESLTYKTAAQIIKDAKNADTSKSDKDEKGKTEKELEAEKEIAKTITNDKEGNEYLWPLSYAKNIDFIVVHHTALTNHLNDPKADMQTVFKSHAISRGWGDIGYNYLIDAKGTIYEGRKGGEKVIGGHSLPLNRVSIGVALLGNYENAELTAPMLNALIALLDEKSKLYKIDPDGKTTYKGKKYNNIQGHFENDATACPGFYARETLPEIRELIQYNQNFYRTAEVAANGENRPFRLLKKPEVEGVKPGQPTQLILRIQNTSGKTWGTNTYLENTDISELPKNLGIIKSSTSNNDIAQFTINIPAHFESDLLMPHLRVVINGTEKTNYTFPYPVVIENVVNSYDVVSVTEPASQLKEGESFTGKIVIKNTGNIYWENKGAMQLNLGTDAPRDHVSTPLGTTNRITTMQESRVEPGKTATFTYTLKRPVGNTSDIIETLTPVMDGALWLTGKPIIITSKGEKQSSSKNGNLRVRLTDSRGLQTWYRLKSEGGVALLNRLNKPSKKFTDGHDVVVERSTTTSGYIIRDAATGLKITSSTPPRFAPLTSNGIITVSNFEKRPEWNKNLNDNRFRGVVEVRREAQPALSGTTNAKTDGLYVINELGLEEYMKGIAEVPNNDEPEKAKALAIAARSYAAYYRDVARKFPGKPYDLDDDPDHTQKYLGVNFEMRSATALEAVKATAGKVITYKGKQVLAPYFNQSAGLTKSAKEAWNRDLPYLQSVPDTFCGSTVLKGHGVGLSGCGATALAKQGKSYSEILKYYYKGIEITGL